MLFSFYVVNRRDMLVFARDENGDPIDIGTCERSTYDRFYYTLLERRTVRPGSGAASRRHECVMPYFFRWPNRPRFSTGRDTTSRTL